MGASSPEEIDVPSPENQGFSTYTERFFEVHPELLDVFDEAFIEELTTYWQNSVRDEFDEPLTPEEEADEIQKALMREMGFLAKVYGSGAYMAEHFPGTVTMLFDVDNTLREPGKDMARPAFRKAVELLDQRFGERLEVGLLTTIRLGELDLKRGGPVYLDQVRHKTNPDYFICSGEYAIDQPEDSALSGWDNKGLIVEDLAHRDLERTFVLVDDLKMSQRPSPANPRVMCVAVTNEIHNDLWRQAALAA